MKKSILINTEEIQQYIKDIRKIPVISHQRQEEIFLRLKDKKIDKKEKEILYNELVVGNLRFVITVAKNYQNQGLDIMDLISEGNIGLIKAAEKFDPTNGVKFISYAVWWVKQSIIACLNENARTIRLPSNLVQEQQKNKKDEVIDENNLLISNQSDTVLGGLPYCISLFDEINEDGDQILDIIPNKNADNPENTLNTPEEIKKKVNLMLSVLDERERTIIEKYYGLTGIETSLEELGEEFGCTKERIRQLRDKSLRILRNNSFYLLKYLDK
jgi:RNA polymerase primary sigma factor